MAYYDDYYGFQALRLGRRSTGSGGARTGEAPEEGPQDIAGRDRRPQDRRGRSGAKRGATTSNATATSRIGCRADGPTCATDRWSICRSRRAASRRSSAARAMYDVKVTVGPVPRARWSAICKDCSGAIDSLVELLQGRFSKGVMTRLCEEKTGLFPSPKDILFTCSCPDWASMCKHVAAVLYGIGARLDHQPELLFTLRKVDQQDLIAKAGLRSLEEGQATSRREGARERRSLGDVRHRDGAGDTVEARLQPARSGEGHRPQSLLPHRPNRKGRSHRRSRRRLRPPRRAELDGSG